MEEKYMRQKNARDLIKHTYIHGESMIYYYHRLQVSNHIF